MVCLGRGGNELGEDLSGPASPPSPLRRMPRRDSAEPVDSMCWTEAAHLPDGSKTQWANRGTVVDSRAYRRPTRTTRRHIFRVGQRAARPFMKRRPAQLPRGLSLCGSKVADARKNPATPSSRSISTDAREKRSCVCSASEAIPEEPKTGR
jgi:hypothetical protein